MFPTDVNFEDIVNTIDYVDNKMTISSKGQSPLFNFDKGEFVFDEYGNIKMVSDENAIRLWIDKSLRTSFHKYEIYYDPTIFREFGTNIRDIYYGHKLPQLLRLGEIERDIKESLTIHEQIRSIENIKLNTEGYTLYISFEVILEDDLGNLLIEKEVRVPHEEEIYRQY